MRKIVLTVLLLALVGCHSDATNPMKCRQAVVEEFNTSEVVPFSDSKFRFIVKDGDGNIWIAETMSAQTPKVTAKTLIFKAQGA